MQVGVRTSETQHAADKLAHIKPQCILVHRYAGKKGLTHDYCIQMPLGARLCAELAMSQEDSCCIT